MIISKDEIVFDNEEQKKEVEAETAKHKSENTEEEYLKRISDESQKLNFWFYAIIDQLIPRT